jgi:uncharacterized protein (DUF58 family)
MLNNLRRIARPGSSLFLVSDFRGAETEDARELLFQLSQHTEITAIKCSDPMEARLPRGGHYAVTDGTRRSELNTADRALRKRYRSRLKAKDEGLARDMLRLGIPLLQARTDLSPYRLLQDYYGERRR